MLSSNRCPIIGILLLSTCIAFAQPAEVTDDSTKTEIKTKVEIRGGKDTTLIDENFEKQYQINILKTHINGVRIPKDLFAAFEQLKLLMDPRTLREFQLLPEERASKKIYLVMWIAQNWNFREGSRLSHLIRQMGITFPEHMAHFVVMTFHRHLNNKDLGIKERVTFYKEKEQEAFERAKRKQGGKVIHEETRTREQ